MSVDLKDRPPRASAVRKAIQVAPTAVGAFYATSMETFRCMFKRPFHAREFVQQAWFIAGVSIMPALLMAIPFCMMFVYQINILLAEIGAVDLSGAGAGVAIIREIGPVVTVLVVAGAGSTAICADLGSRTIREEIDAMKVLGDRSDSTPVCAEGVGVDSDRDVSERTRVRGRPCGRLHRDGVHAGCVSRPVRHGDLDLDRTA